jgi:3-isopropylmalate/(R)-2-methylmalate dehydratase small subunit
MKPFTVVEGVAAPLLEDDVNTDQIAPLGASAWMNPDYAKMLFARRRKTTDGTDDPDFVFNRPQFRAPEILVTGSNLGCGSSREAAVWCLQAIGIRCIVARSFADIFRENCLQNGVAPIVLNPDDASEFETLVVTIDGRSNIRVDLAEGIIKSPDGTVFKFELPLADRTRLLEGLDDIGLTMKHDTEITAYEKRALLQRPWLARVNAKTL